MALLPVLLIALAIPISRGGANAPASAVSPTVRTENALNTALLRQAAGVSGLLAGQHTMQATQVRQGGYVPLMSTTFGASLIPQPLLSAAARLATRGVLGSPGGTGALSAPLRETAVAFTLHEEGLASAQTSYRLTVRSALADLGIDLHEQDIVSPSGDAELKPGMHVYVQYAAAVLLDAGGNKRTAYTQAKDVAGLLEQEGIQMQPRDLIFPSPGTPIRNGMSVSITTVRDGNEIIDEPIPFGTVYRYDAGMSKGETAVAQPGVSGAIRREYRVQRINGRELQRHLLSETMIPPTDEIIAIGTSVPAAVAVAGPAPAAAALGDLACSRILTVWATWYNAANSGGSGITATGTEVYKGIVAVDPRVIPLGTQMYIPGYGYGLAADTGGGVKGNWIDLGYGPDDVYDWRTRWVDICILP